MTPIAGVIELPIFLGIKQCKYMGISLEFPYNNALFGDGSIMTPVLAIEFGLPSIFLTPSLSQAKVCRL